MLLKEYRVVMPLSLDEYHVGQLYAVAQASLQGTGGGEGVEVVTNEAFTDTPLFDGQYADGQFTLKKYHLASRVPAFIRWLVPAGSLEVVEEAWNAFPYCRTLLKNPAYMKQDFIIKVETLHVDNDRGQLENAHQLSPEQLEQRQVVTIDIASDPLPKADLHPDSDPTTFESIKTGRGPLLPGWVDNCEPVMTCYKLVSVEFKWLGLQTRMERFIHRQEQRLFTIFNRKLFCWLDEWHHMSMDDIRALEDRVRKQLDETRDSGDIVGMQLEEDTPDT